MKKQRGPGFYLAWMLAQPLVVVLSFVLGAALDGLFWQRAAQTAQTAGGHPAPVFSLLLPLLGALAASVAFVIALVGLIRCLRRRKKAAEDPAPGTAPRR